jgi:hypothetical protein
MGSVETFSYKTVERALADVHHIGQDAMGAFRGRLQHFQRLGMVPSSPGRGRKISYEKADVFLWAFGLELAEFGMDPTLIKRLLDVYWPSVRPHLLEKAAGLGRFFFFSPSLIGKDVPMTLQQTSDKPHGVPFSVTACVISRLSDLDKLAGKHPNARLSLARFMSRYGMINLSRLRRDVEVALSRYQD